MADLQDIQIQSELDDERMGRVIAVRGPVIDVAFDGDELPPIEDALHITPRNGNVIIAEVQAHLDRHHVRAIALDPTFGLRRGDRVEWPGGEISVPVGEGVLGRLIGVTGAVGAGRSQSQNSQ